MIHFRLFGVLTLLFSFFIVPAWAQGVGRPPLNGASDPDERGGISRDLVQKAKLDRQKKRAEDMKRDSQKLLELATQLKQYVDKAGENILSMDVVRKAEEMEKLARQVKNNMREE
jgi:hypothetical protein